MKFRCVLITIQKKYAFTDNRNVLVLTKIEFPLMEKKLRTHGKVPWTMKFSFIIFMRIKKQKCLFY